MEIKAVCEGLLDEHLVQVNRTLVVVYHVLKEGVSEALFAKGVVCWLTGLNQLAQFFTCHGARAIVVKCSQGTQGDHVKRAPVFGRENHLRQYSVLRSPKLEAHLAVRKVLKRQEAVFKHQGKYKNLQLLFCLLFFPVTGLSLVKDVDHAKAQLLQAAHQRDYVSREKQRGGRVVRVCLSQFTYKLFELN